MLPNESVRNLALPLSKAEPFLSRRYAPAPVDLAAKRSVDLIVASVALVVLMPLMVLVAVCVVISTRGPAIFRQTRMGFDGKRFRILKFRTMHIDAEAMLQRDELLYARYVANGYKLPPQGDPRVTRLGSLLRKLSIDEIPQLVNVLLGHMTLVGPRPVVPDELARYGEYTHFYLDVKPGMTGAWQTGGRSGVDFPERAQIDADYVAGWTFWRDVKILLMTVPAVLRREGAH
jgi:lipopolysaccharide/colanic/teichoic acid biosynthesis glycosyltransferase